MRSSVIDYVLTTVHASVENIKPEDFLERIPANALFLLSRNSHIFEKVLLYRAFIPDAGRQASHRPSAPPMKPLSCHILPQFRNIDQSAR
jgi:hypothetical protein